MKEFSKIPDLQVDLITSSTDKKYFLENIGNNIKIHKLPIGDKQGKLHSQSEKDLLIYSWKAYFYAKKLIRKNSYDLTHSFFTVPCGFISWRLFKKYDIPYIISLRGADVPKYAERFAFIYKILTPLIKKIWKDSQKVVSNSQGLKELALESNPKQLIDIIYNGIDVERFKPNASLKNSNYFIITPGASRITSRKGLKYLIEAVHKLSVKYPQIRLKIMGDGDEEKIKLEKMIKDFDIQDKVDFLGRIPQEKTFSYYQKADVFVLPSLNEGMSNAMLEALSTSLPIIATDTGGSKELIKEGENGYIVKMKDSQDIAEKIEKLINNSELREKMGENSRKKALELSWKNVAENYKKFYVSICENKEKKTKKKNLFLKVLVSIGFVAWLLYRINWNEVLFYLKQMDIWWMLAFMTIYAIGIGISSYKWKILANFKGFNIKYKEFFKIYITGAFINNFLPSIVGGDTYRAYSLGKKSGNERYIESASTVLVDRITGFAGVMILILAFSLFNLEVVLKNSILIIVNFLIVAFFLVNAILVIIRKIKIWIYAKRFIPEKIIRLIRDILSYHQHEILLKSLILGILFNFIGVGMANWMLFNDLHISISFSDFMIAISIISIVSSIPVSIGNIGIKEWAFLTFFGIFGVDGEAVISIAIFGRFLQMLVSFSAIPFYLQDKKEIKTD
jgi:uncharacterized protein (TIRG00374 family)